MISTQRKRVEKYSRIRLAVATAIKASTSGLLYVLRNLINRSPSPGAF
jgi:hypothetical protein